MASKNDERDVYFIPPNFLTGGRLFGGSIRMRNAVEAGFLVLITGIPLFRLFRCGRPGQSPGRQHHVLLLFFIISDPPTENQR